MAKRKVDGCKTTIIKDTRYFHVNTKLFLTEKEKAMVKDDYLPEKISKAIYKYKKSYGENVISIGFGYTIDKSDNKNWKVLRKYVVLETYLKLSEYKRRLIIVNNQQRHMRKIREAFKSYELCLSIAKQLLWIKLQYGSLE